MPRRRLFASLIVLALAALAANLVLASPVPDPAYQLLNAVVPLAIFLGFGLMAVWMVAGAPILIWTPLAMFFAHMAVFRGIGPLVYAFGSDATQDRIWTGAWGLTARELFATHALNLTGAAAVVAGLLVVLLRHDDGPRPVARPGPSPNGVAVAAIGLFLAGAILRYGLIMPVTFGLLAFELPGVLRGLRLMLDIAFALIAYLAVTRGGRWTLLFWLAFPPHLFMLVLEFKKSAVALGLMLPVLGAYLGNGRLRWLLSGALLIGLLTVALHPVVKIARYEMTAMSGEVFGASLSQRVDILRGLVTGEAGAATGGAPVKEAQVGWIRLSYAAQQAIAIRSYDAGQPRDTFSTAWQVFIPRALWPAKPNFTALGDEFYRAITGASGALVGATVFADAYWNHGWAGVLAIGFLAGVFFGLASRFAVRVIEARDFLLLPAVFLAMDMALRELNGWVLTGLIGPLPFIFAYLIAVRLVRAARLRRRLA